MTQKVAAPLMRIVTIATHCISLSSPPGKRYNRAVSVQEAKGKVLSITSLNKRVYNNLHFRNLTVNYLLVCLCLSTCLVFLVLVLGSLSHDSSNVIKMKKKKRMIIFSVK